MQIQMRLMTSKDIPESMRLKDIAMILLEEFMHHSGREIVFVDCVGQNTWMTTLLKTRGFAFSWPLTSMFRGANKYAVRPEFLCAILGPEFG